MKATDFVSDKILLESIKVHSGSLGQREINLFAIIRDESFFLPAFFEHYRRLGVEKFFIVDDGSSDGSLEFIEAQKDCVVLKSRFRYGQRINLRSRYRIWRTRGARAGVEFKRLIPQYVSEDTWCIYADADEFLILPEGFLDLKEYCRYIDRFGYRLIMSSMVTFYPLSVREMRNHYEQPRSFSDLLSVAPFFDCLPTFKFNEKGDCVASKLSVERRLALKYLEESTQQYQSVDASTVSIRKDQMLTGRGERKVSLIKPSRKTFLSGSHEANVKPPPQFVNAIAHFKYTPDLFRRVNLAIETGAWANASKKYRELSRILEIMDQSDGSFLVNCSKKFTGAAQMENGGIILSSEPNVS